MKEKLPSGIKSLRVDLAPTADRTRVQAVRRGRRKSCASLSHTERGGDLGRETKSEKSSMCSWWIARSGTPCSRRKSNKTVFICQRCFCSHWKPRRGNRERLQLKVTAEKKYEPTESLIWKSDKTWTHQLVWVNFFKDKARGCLMFKIWTDRK